MFPKNPLPFSDFPNLPVNRYFDLGRCKLIGSGKASSSLIFGVPNPLNYTIFIQGVWRRNFPGVLAYKFWWSELLQGRAWTNFDLSTAVGKM